MEDKSHIMFSDIQIDFIQAKFVAALNLNKVRIQKDRLSNVLLTFKGIVEPRGIIENVCPTCLGSGRA